MRKKPITVETTRLATLNPDPWITLRSPVIVTGLVADMSSGDLPAAYSSEAAGFLLSITSSLAKDSAITPFKAR